MVLVSACIDDKKIAVFHLKTPEDALKIVDPSLFKTNKILINISDTIDKLCAFRFRWPYI
jgi:hypothetical protein